ncbi:LOW QUALITY PROTEIN: spindle and kinetochore-associated protein 2 [Xyrauchen texanus]|uniref:LOW QUALITY PROTEIN: spindle and kinetochore-associated protein 2 n=1 Tax=Xyrauchen texanus TaxID=154827 RepID=UPI00224247F1|nr:LOW QUALITY PROTEIN: spindle and kinetochore-associated protein 2 [Xyrauchen texanus]
METVDKLEAMFQKSEADIEYVEKQLKFDFMTNAQEAGSFEGNPVQLLENLRVLKARHAAPCAQVEEIVGEQKHSMDSIQAHLDTTIQLVQQLQNTSDTQSVCLAAQIVCEEVTEGTFETFPQSIRGNLKLNDLNTLYMQLSEYIADKKRGPLCTQRMKLNLKFSDSALKTLQHLKIIELDKDLIHCFNETEKSGQTGDWLVLGMHFPTSISVKHRGLAKKTLCP